MKFYRNLIFDKYQSSVKSFSFHEIDAHENLLTHFQNFLISPPKK